MSIQGDPNVSTIAPLEVPEYCPLPAHKYYPFLHTQLLIPTDSLNSTPPLFKAYTDIVQYILATDYCFLEDLSPYSMHEPEVEGTLKTDFQICCASSKRFPSLAKLDLLDPILDNFNVSIPSFAHVINETDSYGNNLTHFVVSIITSPYYQNQYDDYYEGKAFKLLNILKTRGINYRQKNNAGLTPFDFYFHCKRLADYEATKYGISSGPLYRLLYPVVAHN